MKLSAEVVKPIWNVAMQILIVILSRQVLQFSPSIDSGIKLSIIQAALEANPSLDRFFVLGLTKTHSIKGLSVCLPERVTVPEYKKKQPSEVDRGAEY